MAVFAPRLSSNSALQNPVASDNKPYAFLGQYLVGNGLINGTQLQDAVHLQKQNNALIGAIAVAHELLDREQLKYLVRRQFKVDERIGTLAIEEGFITGDQLETILSVQAENHIFLGESLVRLGTIGQEALNEALNDFETQIVYQEQRIREEISLLPMGRQALVTLNVALRYFYRLGYPIRIVGTGKSVPRQFEHLYYSEQIFKKAATGYMGLGLTNMLVTSISQIFNLPESYNGDETDAHAENISQLTFNMNYMACKQMKKLGIRVKHGAAFMGASTDDEANGVCFEMETITSPMVLTYS